MVARIPLPWPALIVATLQTLALLLLTLILVCPTPFQSNSIALLTVRPQTIATSSNSVVNMTGTGNGMSDQFASKTIATSPNSSPIANSSASAAVTAAVASSGLSKRLSVPSTPQIVANSSSIMSNSTTNSTAISGNVTISSLQSDLLLRLGPLGTCFRTSTGVDSCSTAKLSGAYDFTGLQRAIDESKQAFDVSSALPGQRSFFSTVLLIAISACAVVVFVNAGHVYALIAQAKIDAGVELRGGDVTAKESRARSDVLGGEMPWLAMAETTKWAAVCCSALVFVSAGVQKYSFNNAKNAFNAASPTGLAPSGYRGNSTTGTITLVADTGSGFGFAWVAAIALLTSFWIQRTFLRRQRALVDARRELRLRRSASSLSHNSPPPNYHSRGRLASQDELLATLPSLRKAHEGNARLDESRDVPAPFATYQSPAYVGATHNIRDNVRCAAADRHVAAMARSYPPPAASRFALAHPDGRHTPPTMSERDSIEQLSQCMCGGGGSLSGHHHDNALPRDVKPASVRSISPAPSYWTGEWRVGGVPAAKNEVDRERERHFMAELRRKRSAMDG